LLLWDEDYRHLRHHHRRRLFSLDELIIGVSSDAAADILPELYQI